MNNYTYKLRMNPDDAVEFVNQASNCEFDIDIFYNRFIIDAKSILGVLGLDFTRELNVVCHGFSGEFDSYIRRYAVAC